MNLKATRRGGAVLALVLAGLLVVSILGAAMLQTVLVQGRQRQVLQQRQQCFWLAEAGIQRAARGIAGSPDYEGETWSVPAEVLGTSEPGVVVIEVIKAEGSPETRKARVEARMSDGPVRRNVCRREITVPVGSEKPAGPADENKTGGSGAAEHPAGAKV